MKKSRIIKVAVVLVAAAVVMPILYKLSKEQIRAAYDARNPRPTSFPSSDTPDQVCLTWSDDPATTQTIQWRVSETGGPTTLEYRKSTDNGIFTASTVSSIDLIDPLIVNDPKVIRTTATITGLDPSTTYSYRAGNESTNVWTDWEPFTTAPRTAESFSFFYFGDVQIGYPTWGKLLDTATDNSPGAAFCLTAGDQVNRGNWRNEWDGFFAAGSAFLKTHRLVPAIGNHECPLGGAPWMYLEMFALPENGPKEIPKERAYSFRYSNALFVVLDSNLSVKKQRPWLEQQLSTSNDTWKFVMYHHPAYSASGHRDNEEVREQWCDLFDKYHVDVAFQGHDHAYLRTPPMKAEKKVAAPADGTIYVIADAGEKFYKAAKHDYAAVSFEDTPTWQIIDINVGQTNKLTYRSFDLAGELRDEFSIEK